MILVGPSSKMHGTRACYVNGCRCDECRAAVLRAYHKRQKEIYARKSEVVPSGPPIPSVMIRRFPSRRPDGRKRKVNVEYKIFRCPGANGKKCVVKGGSWLKGNTICFACVVKATVWDGLVSATKAREHILSLRAKGIGKRSVAAACNIGLGSVCKIIQGKKKIRANTEKQILSVDIGALADGAVLDSKEANGLIDAILARGFKKTELARLLGSVGRVPSLQLGKAETMTLGNIAKVKKLAKMINQGKVFPKSWGPKEDCLTLVRREVPVPSLTNNKDDIAHFLLELKELRALVTTPAFTRKTNEEIIHLSKFRETA